MVQFPEGEIAGLKLATRPSRLEAGWEVGEVDEDEASAVAGERPPVLNHNGSQGSSDVVGGETSSASRREEEEGGRDGGA